MKFYTLPLLSEEIAKKAQELLPRFSGQNKVLEFLICFNYGAYTEGWLAGESENQHIKIVFWHPNNAMLVSYNFETHVDDIPSEMIITSSHSSTWREGLNFFHEILEEPKSYSIVGYRIIEDCTCEVIDDKFVYSSPSLQE